MTSSETHQGYANYATFGVDVTIQNDRTMHDAAHAALAQIRHDAHYHRNVPDIWTKDEAIRFVFADWLKNYVAELCEGATFPQNSGHLMAAQMAQAGMSEVDWDELATSWLAEAKLQS